METGWLMVAVGVCLLLATEPGTRWTKAAVTAVPGWWWSAWSSSASEDGGGAAAGTEVAEREVQMQLSDEEERMQGEDASVSVSAVAFFAADAAAVAADAAAVAADAAASETKEETIF